MYALGGHARRTVVPRAVRSLGVQQANYATRGRPRATPAKSVKPVYVNDVVAKLAADGVWNSMRAVSRAKAAKNTDKYRINIVSEKLCDDAINYIRPTLA